MEKCLREIAYRNPDFKSNKIIGLNEIHRKYNIPKRTILRHLKGTNKFANGGIIRRGSPPVLGAEVEEELVEYCQDLDSMLIGITRKDLMKLAYDLAVMHNDGKSARLFGNSTKTAGKKWYKLFMKRHPELSLRSPENTSLARARGFNHDAVKTFFDLYEKLLDKHKFDASRISNMDETAHTTVQKPSRVISSTGKKQVGCISSAERGQNTTGVYCNSADGTFIPPMLIYKRKRIPDDLTVGAPVGTSFQCTDSGWMDSPTFEKWVRHYIDKKHPTKEKPHLLLLDGCKSHTKNVPAIKLAKENGVIMLSLPPHCSHRIQPLDVSFFKSLKNYYNLEIEKWLRTNNYIAASVRQVATFVNGAFSQAATIPNAVNGYMKSGIWPCNRHAFDAEFQQMGMFPEDTSSDNNPPIDVNTHEPENARIPNDESGNVDNDLEMPGYEGPVNCTNEDIHDTDTDIGESFATCDENNNGGNSPATVIIPTKGDGKCFFRSLAICINEDLRGQRNENSELIDEIGRLKEIALADNLRSGMVQEMCKLNIEPGSELLSADMPERVRFNSLAERILSMSEEKSMIGEMEIVATAAFIQREIQVVNQQGGIYKYGRNIKTGKPIIVKYTELAPAVGHYDSVVSMSTSSSTSVNTHYENNSTSTCPRMSTKRTAVREKLEKLKPTPPAKVAKVQKRRKNQTQSEVLTSTPYKEKLDQENALKEEKINKLNTSLRNKNSMLKTSRTLKFNSAEKAPKNKKLSVKKSAKQLQTAPENDDKTINSTENAGPSKTENSEESWLCFYCDEDCKENMIQCVMCKRWAHVQCAGVASGIFVCELCT